MVLGSWGYPQWYILWNRNYRRADVLGQYARRRTLAGTEWRLADGRTSGRPGTLPMGVSTSEQDCLTLPHAEVIEPQYMLPQCWRGDDGGLGLMPTQHNAVPRIRTLLDWAQRCCTEMERLSRA